MTADNVKQYSSFVVTADCCLWLAMAFEANSTFPDDLQSYLLEQFGLSVAALQHSVMHAVWVQCDMCAVLERCDMLTAV